MTKWSITVSETIISKPFQREDSTPLTKNEGPATIQLRVNTAGNTEQVSFLSDVFFHSCVFFKYKNIKVP